jgi:hypothetical protein
LQPRRYPDRSGRDTLAIAERQTRTGATGRRSDRAEPKSHESAGTLGQRTTAKRVGQRGMVVSFSNCALYGDFPVDVGAFQQRYSRRCSIFSLSVRRS